MRAIGRSFERYEDDALIRGQGRYTGDLRVPGELAMMLVRSPAAAGRIADLELENARAMPGVLGVYASSDLRADGIGLFTPRLKHPGPDGGEMRVPPFPPLADGVVRYVGEPVAVVLAETHAAAEDAAEAVALDVEECEAVVDPLEAAADGAPRVWDLFPDNHCFRVEKGDGAAVEAAFARAAHVVRRRLWISRVTAATLEPRNVLARYDAGTGHYRLDLGTQTPHRLLLDLAPVLGVTPDAVRVVTHACGGAFGMKNTAYAEYAVALWAARRTGRPVRWTASRTESFQSDAHAREQWADAALALDGEGRFLALDVRIAAGLGACLGPATPHPPVANLGGLAGVYRTPAIRAVVDGYFTNTQSVAPYRGAGRPEATYILERMIDLAAGALDMDRAEIRRRNMIRPEEMPFKTGLVYTYDSGDFPAILEKALGAADWRGFPRRRAEAEMRGRLRGIGIACPIEIAGGPAARPHPEFARVELSPDGRMRVLSGSSDSGQGHVTAFRQVVADRLGLLPEQVEVVTGDTAVVPRGTGTFGSRTMGAAGTSLWRSMEEIVERLKADAADRLEAAVEDVEFAHGLYRIAGTDRAISFAEVLGERREPLSAERWEGTDGATFPNGCHLCEVEIDPETGEVDVVGYWVVDDVGTVINPLLLKGQIAGGVAQGLGQALMENVIYEPCSGQLLSASFMDYAMPRAADLPDIAVASHPVPAAGNPLGVKGAGEAGTVGALPAVMNAICDALATRGADPIDMPATAQRVWQALARAGSGSEEPCGASS